MLKINTTINQIYGYKNKTNEITGTIEKQTLSTSFEVLNQKVFAKNLFLNKINFKGNQESELFNSYKQIITDEKRKPLDAFCSIDADNSQMTELFEEILKADEYSHSFIWDIVKEPRKRKINLDRITEKVGKNSRAVTFYSINNVYQNAYSKFLNKLYNEAESLEELLRFRPDWKEEAIINKVKTLYNTDQIVIGKPPEDISRHKLDKIFEYLNQCNQIGFKRKIDIPPLNIDGQEFKFRYFLEGKTTKNVYGVETNGKKYVLKIGKEKDKSFTNQSSLGVLALIDNYLTLNNSKNSAPIIFYNHNKNYAVYEQISEELKEFESIYPGEINKKLPDFNQLGLYYNDTLGEKNCFLIDSKDARIPNELISVDNDHVTFNQNLMPLVYELNQRLPNHIQNLF